MAKISMEDLQKIKENVKGVLDINQGDYKAKITVHMGTCGISAGATPVMEALKEESKEQSDILLTSSGCPGLCSQEPIITVELRGEEPVKYVFVDKEKAVKIFREHVLEGNIVVNYALVQGREKQ